GEPVHAERIEKSRMIVALGRAAIVVAVREGRPGRELPRLRHHGPKERTRRLTRHRAAIVIHLGGHLQPAATDREWETRLSRPREGGWVGRRRVMRLRAGLPTKTAEDLVSAWVETVAAEQIHEVVGIHASERWQ